MSFPSTPTIGQTTTTNGITYVYSTSSNSVGYWTRVPTTITISTSSGGSGGGSSIKSTTTSTPPAGASIGDIWYYQGTDVVYRYEFDGTTTTWIDISGPTVYAVGSFGGGITYTTNNTPPATPNVGDQWYEASTNIVYRYTYDGVSNYWVDISGYGGFSGGTVLGATTIANTLSVTNNIIIGTANTSTSTVGLTVGTTDAIILPIGTTAQRPISPVNGMIRFNSSTTSIEGFIAGNWYTILSGNYTAQYLVVGGGGAGSASNSGGGGGAGGIIYGSVTISAGTTYSIVVGAGGTGSSGAGTSGTNSSFYSFTAIGGGAGGYGGVGGSGGSGGGAGGNTTGGSGTSPQGYNGSSGSTYGSGGGGGAGGGGVQTGSSGNGGPGIVNPIVGSTTGVNSGTNYYIGGGGGGGGYDNGGSIPATAGLGGSGGGGAGGPFTPITGGVAGTTNTGGGGGGGSTYNPGSVNGNGGNGGSGVVILSIPTIYYTGRYTGTVSVTPSGSNTILTWTTGSGSYTA